MPTRFQLLEEELAEHAREAFERAVWPAEVDLRDRPAPEEVEPPIQLP